MQRWVWLFCSMGKGGEGAVGVFVLWPAIWSLHSMSHFHKMKSGTSVIVSSNWKKYHHVSWLQKDLFSFFSYTFCCSLEGGKFHQILVLLFFFWACFMLICSMFSIFFEQGYVRMNENVCSKLQIQKTKWGREQFHQFYCVFVSFKGSSLAPVKI
jgi:hypothetical protein